MAGGWCKLTFTSVMLDCVKESNKNCYGLLLHSVEKWNVSSTKKSVYLTISAKATSSGLTLYGMLCLAHRAFTCGWILYKLWRGMVGNKLKTVAHTQLSSLSLSKYVSHFISVKCMLHNWQQRCIQQEPIWLDTKCVCLKCYDYLLQLKIQKSAL